MVSVSYAGKTSGVSRGGASGANRGYVMAHFPPSPFFSYLSNDVWFTLSFRISVENTQTLNNFSDKLSYIMAPSAFDKFQFWQSDFVFSEYQMSFRNMGRLITCGRSFWIIKYYYSCSSSTESHVWSKNKFLRSLSSGQKSSQCQNIGCM